MQPVCPGVFWVDVRQGLPEWVPVQLSQGDARMSPGRCPSGASPEARQQGPAVRSEPGIRSGSGLPDVLVGGLDPYHAP